MLLDVVIYPSVHLNALSVVRWLELECLVVGSAYIQGCVLPSLPSTKQGDCSAVLSRNICVMGPCEAFLSL